jgi:hypothetical protein
LVHFFYFSSFYLGPILMVVSKGLKIIYSLLHRKFINHIHPLNFLLYTFPLIYDLPFVWPIFQNIAVFVSGIHSTYEEKHAAFILLNLTNSLKMMFSSSIYLPANDKIPLFFMTEKHSILYKILHFLDPFIISGASWLFP